MLARPAIAAPPGAGAALDVVVIGAGAAGIAAARKLADAGRRYLVLEATDHVGGRCVTDTASFGVPFDRGARWIWRPDTNPIIRLAARRGADLYPAPQSRKVRVGRRFAREGELEDFLAAQVRAQRAITDVARRADTAAATALPGDLGDWRATVAFLLGPYGSAKDLAQLSALDFARAADRDTATFCRQGFGALLAGLADGLAIQFATPAVAIETRVGVSVTTAKGTITARTAIVTVPTNVIKSGGLKLSADFGRRAGDLFDKLSLGSYDHIALELVGNPLGLDSDDLIFEKSTDTRTAAIVANLAGSTLCTIDVAGQFGRDLSATGEAAMVDFATEWLGNLFGAEVKRSIGRKKATRWNSEPFALGAWSAAAPGGQSARRALFDPIADGVWYAGEAAHETLWGTVGGAWESGERAADAVLRRLGPIKAAPAAAEAEPPPNPTVKRKPARQPGTPRREATSPSFTGTPTIMREER
jgi:monoamine oxidase